MCGCLHWVGSSASSKTAQFYSVVLRYSPDELALLVLVVLPNCCDVKEEGCNDSLPRYMPHISSGRYLLCLPKEFLGLRCEHHPIAHFLEEE